MTSKTATSSISPIRVLPVRDDSFLLELADLDHTLALLDALRAEPIEEIREIVPAARTLLISFDSQLVTLNRLLSEVSLRTGRERKAVVGRLVEIPIIYDGEDLAGVAATTGLTVDELVTAHVSSEYVVAFTGFAPGFAYMYGGDPRLVVPRRKSPRTQVPAGSVGLAGEFCGIYPKNSPGGWQLIGRTPETMFDVHRNPPALLEPGDRVRFRKIAERLVAANTTSGEVSPPTPQAKGPALEIMSAALPVLFQDLGRPGQAHQGISVSGAADRTNLRAANRLVGNAAGNATLEITLGNLSFRVREAGVMALTGAPAPISITSRDGARISAPHHAAVALDDGDLVTLGAPSGGLRSYLAVRGGFRVDKIIGSAATDTLAQLGPAALGRGDVIGIEPASAGSFVSTDSPAFTMPTAGDTIVLDVHMGPRTDWFTPEAITSFLAQEWLITPLSNRVGIKLSGQPLARKVQSELPSEATVRGALQVPANGQPILFLADHPLTGGYPVIANVAHHHLDLAGQIPAGAKIRFNALRDFSARELPGPEL